MRERHTYVRPIRVEFECERCYFGTLVATDREIARDAWNKPRYEHECTNRSCGAVEILHEKYPHIIYEEIHE